MIVLIKIIHQKFKAKNRIASVGDIDISIKCRSYPNRHKSIFENSLYRKFIFQNWFFSKIETKMPDFHEKNDFFFKKIFGKWFFIFQKFWKIIFLKSEYSKIDKWQFDFDRFLTIFRRMHLPGIMSKLNILYL